MVDELFVATKAFIEHDGKVLVIRESSDYSDGSNEGLFDVVGGRVEPGEKYDESLKREVKEETGLNVEINSPFAVREWRPEVKGEKWQIVGVFFKCKADSKEVILGRDHEEYKWINPESHEEYNIIPNLSDVFDQYVGG